MFRMRLNSFGHVESPNSLVLDNVEIRNVFYDMNSIINLTAHGGHIEIKNSIFHKISMCGSIIKNY